MKDSILRFLGIKQEATELPKIEALAPEDVSEGLQVAAQEIAKLRRDNEYIENRLRDEVQQYRQAFELIKNDRDAMQAELAEAKKAVTEAEQSAREQAVQMLATVGHEAIDVTGAAGKNKSRNEEIVAEYRQMAPGKPRQRFYEQHKAVLDAEFGAPKFNLKVK